MYKLGVYVPLEDGWGIHFEPDGIVIAHEDGEILLSDIEDVIKKHTEPPPPPPLPPEEILGEGEAPPKLG